MAHVSVSKPLQEVSAFLDNYWNRDKVFRTAQYVSTLCSGLLQSRLPGAATKFAAVSSSLSNARTTLRLLDDIPNLTQTLAGWKRPKDSSPLLQIVDFLSSLSGLLYYPTEHIAWAADLNILSIQSTPAWNFCVILWITSLLASCMRSLATLWMTGKEIRMLQRHSQPQLSPTSPSLGSSRDGNGRKRVSFQDESTSSSHTRLRVLRRMYFQAVVKLAQTLSDMVNAVHYLPSGVLWSGKLPTLWVGVFGTLSSLLGLYNILPCGPKPS